jgi:protein SCO1/2
MQQRLGSDERWALAGLVAMFAITAAWWALALWPVAEAPGWLERTRAVCFGVTETGLPDTTGWVGLIGAPLGMLMIVLVGWAGGLRRLIEHAHHSIPIAATFIALALGTTAMVAGASLRVQQAHAAASIPESNDARPAATWPRLDDVAPPLDLVGHDGFETSLASLRGRPVLVTFAYAHCTTVCPLIVRDVLAAQSALATSHVKPAVLIVTLDPWRDTPSRLPVIAREWKLPAGHAWLLGGTPARVEAVLTDWNVMRRRDGQTGEVIHPSLVYVLDAQGRIAFITTGGAELLAALLRRLEQEA